MHQIGSGYQPMDGDTLVCNEEVSKDPLDGIATLNDSAKGRLYCVKLDAGKTGTEHEGACSEAGGSRRK